MSSIMYRVVLLILLCWSGVFAQEKSASQTVTLQGSESVDVILSKPLDVSVQLQKPIKVETDDSLKAWFKGEAGSGWAAFVAALATFLLLIRQNHKQNEVTNWQQKQAEFETTDRLWHKIMDADALWNGEFVQRAHTEPPEHWNLGGIGIFRLKYGLPLFQALDYFYFLKERGTIKDADMIAYMTTNSYRWATEFTVYFGDSGPTFAPTLRRVLDIPRKG